MKKKIIAVKVEHHTGFLYVFIGYFLLFFFINEKADNKCQEKQKIADKHIQEASMMLNLHRNKLNYLIGETKVS
jgi:two-component system, sporulation sensor kinase D